MDFSLLSNHRGKINTFLSQEKIKLRRLNLLSCIVLGSVVSAILTVQDIVERYREIILFSDGIAATIESHIESSHKSDNSLDEHLESYRNKVNQQQGEFGKTASIFLLDSSGRIFATSIPSWRDYTIYDRSIRNPTNENRLLERIIDCFEGISKDNPNFCRETELAGASFFGNIITISKHVKPVVHQDQKTYLLVVNYDPSTIYQGLLEDLTLIIVISFVFAYLSYAGLFRHFEKILLPRLYSRTQVDSLTGCSDRFAFVDDALRVLDSSSSSGTEMMLVLFDISSFKEINSRIGPARSDQLLIALSNTIRDNIDIHKDLLGRLESDIFIGLIYTSGTASFLDSISYQFELTSRAFSLDKFGFRCKIGCVRTSSFGYNLDFLMSRATTALSEAKTRSDSYVIYGEEHSKYGQD